MGSVPVSPDHYQMGLERNCQYLKYKWWANPDLRPKMNTEYSNRFCSARYFQIDHIALEMLISKYPPLSQIGYLIKKKLGQAESMISKDGKNPS
jgi:hypothetical protein